MGKGSISAIVVFGIILVAIFGFFGYRQQHAQDCHSMLFKINQLKGGVSQQLFNSQGLDQMIDQYNAQCAGTVTNYAANNPGSGSSFTAP